MTTLLWYLGGMAILAVALFFPMRNLIWVLSVRRLERTTGKALSLSEQKAQKQRAGFVASLVSVAFSAAFNYATFGIGTP